MNFYNRTRYKRYRLTRIQSRPNARKEISSNILSLILNLKTIKNRTAHKLFCSVHSRVPTQIINMILNVTSRKPTRKETSNLI